MHEDAVRRAQDSTRALRNVSKGDGHPGGRGKPGEKPGHRRQFRETGTPFSLHTLFSHQSHCAHTWTHTTRAPSLLLRTRGDLIHRSPCHGPFFPLGSRQEAARGGDPLPRRGHSACVSHSTDGLSQTLLLNLWEPFQRPMGGNPHPPLTGPKPVLFLEGEGRDGAGRGGGWKGSVRGASWPLDWTLPWGVTQCSSCKGRPPHPGTPAENMSVRSRVGREEDAQRYGHLIPCHGHCPHGKSAEPLQLQTLSFVLAGGSCTSWCRPCSAGQEAPFPSLRSYLGR